MLGKINQEEISNEASPTGGHEVNIDVKKKSTIPRTYRCKMCMSAHALLEQNLTPFQNTANTQGRYMVKTLWTK